MAGERGKGNFPVIFLADTPATPTSVRQMRARTRRSSGDDVMSSVSTRRTSKKRSASPSFKPEREQSTKISRRSSCSRLSKRRSSFVRGRINQPAAKPLTDLDAAIADDIPEEEKMAALHHKAMQQTLMILNEEFSDLDGMQQFTVEANERLGQVVEEMKQDGKFAAVCCSDSDIPDPQRELVNKKVRGFDVLRERMKQESETWEKTLQTRTKKAEQAIKLAEDAQSHPLTPQSDVSMETFFQADQPDYGQLGRDLERSREELTLKVEELSRACQILKRYESSAVAHVADQVQTFDLQSFAGIQDFDKPDILLQNMLT